MKLRILKNDVIIINTSESKRDKSGNRYFNFGECYIVRNGKRMYFSDWLKDWDDYKRPTWFGGHQWTNQIKPMLKNYFPSFIDSDYISDYPNVVCFHNEP